MNRAPLDYSRNHNQPKDSQYPIQYAAARNIGKWIVSTLSWNIKGRFLGSLHRSTRQVAVLSAKVKPVVVTSPAIAALACAKSAAHTVSATLRRKARGIALIAH